MNPDQEAREAASDVVSRFYHEEPEPCPVCVQQARRIIDAYIATLPPDVLVGRDGMVRVEQQTPAQARALGARPSYRLTPLEGET